MPSRLKKLTARIPANKNNSETQSHFCGRLVMRARRWLSRSRCSRCCGALGRGCGAHREPATRRRPGGRGRELLGLHRRPARRQRRPACRASSPTRPQDPHSYEPTANDARLLATSQLAIVNGVGYDPWAPKLLAANPDARRTVLTVRRPVRAAATATTRIAGTARPNVDSVAYDDHRRPEEARPQERRPTTRAGSPRSRRSDLAPYHELIAQIKRRYRGVPVGASESIFALLAPARWAST